LKSSLKWVIVYLLLIQFGLSYVVPTTWMYDKRIRYEVFKEDTVVLDAVLDQIKRQVDREGLTDYVVILGDSVGYSGPGGPDQSIGYYMSQISQEQGKPLTVFNLALPAMQIGDFYTVLLKLRAKEIATPRLVINLMHAGFVARAPYPPVVFWLDQELKRMDHDSWARVEQHLIQADRAKEDPLPSALFQRYVAPHVALLRYRPVIKGKLMSLFSAKEVYDTRVWTEKPGLAELLQGYEYQIGFNPAPVDLTDQNPQIYFLQKLMDLTRNDQVLYYLTPTNQELMKANVSNPGYRANVEAISRWMTAQGVDYLNLESALDPSLFADHVHLTPEGYRVLAGRLLEHLNQRAGQ